MKRKMARYLLTAAFLAALYLPHVLWALMPADVRDTSGENRVLAAYPVLSADTLESYPAAWEAWYEDHMPFRRQLTGLYSWLSYAVFHASTHENVVLGRDGWLFYDNPADGDPMGQYTGEVVWSEEEMERIARKLTAFRDTLEAQGKEFVVFVAPNKARVYSEYLPRSLSGPAWDNPVDSLVEYLSMNTDLRLVTAIDALLYTRVRQPELPLYYATDTHWNALGAYVGARELLGELGYDMPGVDEISVVDLGAYAGDLAGMLGLGDYLRTDRLYAVMDYCQTYPTVLEENFFGLLRYETPGADERKLLVIRDSFCTAMAHVLASQFRWSTMVHKAAFTPEVIEQENPDVVVYEVAERYFSWPYIEELKLE